VGVASKREGVRPCNIRDLTPVAGAGYPPTGLDPFQITRTSVQELQPGIAFVLHACLLDETAQVGVVVGGTYAMTEAGVELLAGAGAIDLHTT
jgi:hypothetical protein